MGECVGRGRGGGGGREGEMHRCVISHTKKAQDVNMVYFHGRPLHFNEWQYLLRIYS